VLARPWQWIKNGLVLAALASANGSFPRDAVPAALQLAAFCAFVELGIWRTRGWIVGNG